MAALCSLASKAQPWVSLSKSKRMHGDLATGSLQAYPESECLREGIKNLFLVATLQATCSSLVYIAAVCSGPHTTLQ